MELFSLFGKIGIKNQEANKAIDDTVGKAESSGGKIINSFRKVATVVGGLFAGKALIDFGKSTVEAAANAQAIQAQFDQVFEGIEDKATKKLNEVAKTAGALPNRMKPAFNQIASFAKVTGMDAGKSLDFASRATAAAADSAAFYDKSLEETTETLKSYLKGNYEVADNLGILSTEQTRNAAATELFGKKFKDLEGLQQQEVLMKMYEDANKVSGAMGQAARESDGFENVMGNLKQAWEDFKASIGGNFLAPVVSGVQLATTYVQKFQTWVGQLKTELNNNGAIENFKTAFANTKEVIGDVISGVSGFITKLTGIDGKQSSIDTIGNSVQKVSVLLSDTTGKIKDFVDWFEKGGTSVDVLKSAIVGVTGAWTTYKVVTGVIQGIEAARNVILGVSNGLMIARAVQTGALTAAEGAHAAATVAGTGAMAAFNAVMAINPFTIIITAIAAAVAGLIWFFTQTETGKEIWKKFTSFLGESIEAAKQIVSDVTSKIVSSVTEGFASMKAKAVEIWDGLKNSIKEKMDSAKDLVKTAIDKIKGFFNFEWSLPRPKIPSFRVSGGKAPWGFMGKGSLPSVGIEWYKNGGIMTSPTLFGMNGNRAMVGGEAGPEAVLPLNAKTLSGIGKGIVDATESDTESLEILYQILAILQELLDKDPNIVLDDGTLVSKTWKKYKDKIDAANARKLRLQGDA